ncbi:glucose-6-phosphate isomerase [Acinetobacter baumannii]|nr:glucose-6-phosphate isomerase [Acinetobacter baumannii]
MSKSIEKFPKELVSPIAQLHSLVEKNSKLHIKELFAAEQDRFQNYSVKFDQLVFDYSKHRITKSVLEQLFALAKTKQLTHWIERLFSQDKVNCTEQRAAMHWALRLPSEYSKFPELTKQVHTQLQRMYALVEKIHAGQYRGATGEVIQDVVNIGVGGSDLGPQMVTHALRLWMVASYQICSINCVRKQLYLLFLQSHLVPLIPYQMHRQFVSGLKKL